jgi:hypothetical protein
MPNRTWGQLKAKALNEDKRVLMLAKDDTIREGDFLNWCDGTFIEIDKGSPMIGKTVKDESPKHDIARIVDPLKEHDCVITTRGMIAEGKEYPAGVKCVVVHVYGSGRVVEVETTGEPADGIPIGIQVLTAPTEFIAPRES